MRVAIVGSGVSGLSALWALKKYSDHEVNIYEQASQPGGQVQTVALQRDGKEPCTVDTALMAFNSVASPNLVKLLTTLEVPLVKTLMSMSVTRDGQAKRSLAGNFLNPQAWRLALDIARFNLTAADLLDEDQTVQEQITLKQYLDRERYSTELFQDYLLPLIATTWLVADDLSALDMPAAEVISGLAADGHIQPSANPEWLTIQGGAKAFVDKLAHIVPPENLHLNTEIVSITSHDYGVRLVEASGANHIYDHVILATPANKTLSMLQRGGWASPEEEQVLRPVKWHSVETELHGAEKDGEVMGDASVNFSSVAAPPAYDNTQPGRTSQVSLTFNMNTIQHLSEDRHGKVLLSINPPWSAEPHTASSRGRWEVPIPTPYSGPPLADIQNTRRITYAGGWSAPRGAEAAVTSALSLATSEPFNASAPFPLATPQRRAAPASLKILKAAITVVERFRRAIAPFWGIVGWPVALVLLLVQQVARPLALLGVPSGQRAERSIAHLRACWLGQQVN